MKSELDLCQELSPQEQCTLLPDHPGQCTTWTAWHYGLPADIDRDTAFAATIVNRQIQLDRIWVKKIPRRFQDVEYGTLNLPTDITKQLDAWLVEQLAENCGTLILFGPVGSGKTHTAMATLRALHNRHRAIAYTSAANLFDQLRPEGTGHLTDYTEPSTLLIDDLGTTKNSEWTEQTLFDIIDTRWREERVTIVTTNLSVEELKTAVGLRTYDRLRDGATAIVLPGPSRRRSAA